MRNQRARLARRRAQRLRLEDTDAEARLWRSLRDRKLGGWKWRRQVPVGRYIADFLCPEGRLVVELDGAQHAEQLDYDQRRTVYLERRGLRVLRFWNSEALTNTDGVCATILDALGGDRPGWDPIAEATARLSPQGRG
ncbi:endonuclease domain-containing protein [Phenylobacterium sp.]|uniref:endonuclease domain-containing protein n=1 Tax=Phenylobacterium sp. TaxID=1871053 RepID=UPI002F930D47